MLWSFRTCPKLSNYLRKINIKINISGEPFFSKPGYLAKLVKKSVKKYTGISANFSTTGGTSDARYIIKKCPVVEFGLVGKKMHAVDESVQTSQIIGLENIYSDILNNFYIDVKKDRKWYARKT